MGCASMFQVLIIGGIFVCLFFLILPLFYQEIIPLRFKINFQGSPGQDSRIKFHLKKNIYSNKNNTTTFNKKRQLAIQHHLNIIISNAQ